MRIFVTGGTGYVGSALVPALAHRFPEANLMVYDSEAFGNPIAGTSRTTFVKGDLRDPIELDQALIAFRPTVIIHLAGIVTDDLVAMNEIRAREINVEALAGLVQGVHQLGCQRFILMSSSAVYGTQPGIATEETQPLPMTAYARQKLQQEWELFADGGPVTKVAVRSATLCGPAPRMRLDTIVNTFSKQAWFDRRLTVHGGEQWRTNLNVKDLVEFYCTLLVADPKLIDGQVFNVTTGDHQAKTLAHMAARLLPAGGPAAQIVVEDRPDPRSYRMSAEKAQRVLGWQPTHSIEAAMLDNFTWFAQGKIADPNADLYYNTRRMKEAMTS